MLWDCRISLFLSPDWSQRPPSFPLRENERASTKQREGKAAEVKHKGKQAAAICLQQQPRGKERTRLQYHIYLFSTKWFWEVKMACCMLLLFPCRQNMQKEKNACRNAHTRTFKTTRNCLYSRFMVLLNTSYFTKTVSQRVTALRDSVASAASRLGYCPEVLSYSWQS